MFNFLAKMSVNEIDTSTYCKHPVLQFYIEKRIIKNIRSTALRKTSKHYESKIENSTYTVQ